MSITWVCLVKGNLPANAFDVDIDSGKLVSTSKKAKKAPELDHIPADSSYGKWKFLTITIPS